MHEELIERIAAQARERGSLEAEAIARDFLRLSSPGAKAAASLSKPAAKLETPMYLIFFCR